MINDLISNSNENIINKEIINSDDVRNCDSLVIGFSDEIKILNMELKKFLYSNLYKHPDVIKMTDQANLVIENLFSAYMNDMKLIPNDYIQYNLLKINSGFKERVICDYIAGMTDRFAQLEYTKIFNNKS